MIVRDLEFQFVDARLRTYSHSLLKKNNLKPFIFLTISKNLKINIYIQSLSKPSIFLYTNNL